MNIRYFFVWQFNENKNEGDYMFIEDIDLIKAEKAYVLLKAKTQCQEEIMEIRFRIRRFKEQLESKYKKHKYTEEGINRMINSDNREIEKLKQRINILETWIREVKEE